MSEDHVDYFLDIGMSQVAINRANYLRDLLQRVSPSKIEDIFISDSISEEGIRSQESMWCFGSGRVTEFKNMMTSVNFDFMSLEIRPVWVDVVSQDYDFEEVNDKSRLVVNTVIRHPMGMALKATRNNCPHLTRIMQRWLSVL